MTDAAAKERPIIFSAAMIQALLDGRKTQTRRICKPTAHQRKYVKEKWSSHQTTDAEWNEMAGIAAKAGLSICPRDLPWRVGDRLWVREAWARTRNNLLFAADCVASEGPQGNTDDWDWDASCGKNVWKSPLFMPRWASRLTLEITGVRVEKIASINSEDAIQEGVSSVGEFRNLWNSIHGESSWETNVWVWILEFRRVLP